jgi:hypothetical protein
MLINFQKPLKSGFIVIISPLLDEQLPEAKESLFSLYQKQF